MTIVQICPSPFPSTGGPARNYVQFRNAIRSEVICFVRPGEGAREQFVVTPTHVVTASRLPLLRKYYYTGSRSTKHRAAELVRSAACVVLHSFYQYPATWVSRLCRQSGIPYIIVLHGVLDPWTFGHNRALKGLWMFLYGERYLAGASRVVCATEREFIKARRFIRPEQKAVIRWCVTTPDLNPYQSRRETVRSNLGIDRSDRVLVSLGRLDRMKRPAAVVEACARSGASNLKLLVIGPDGNVSQDDLRAAASKYHWNGLRTVGPIFDHRKDELLAASDGYISLSWRENFNFSAAEALSVGLPLILSPGNDLGWEFEGQGFGWQLKTDAIEEAVSTIREFAERPAGELQRMGALGRDWAARALNRMRFDAELQSLISNVAGAGVIRNADRLPTDR